MLLLQVLLLQIHWLTEMGIVFHSVMGYISQDQIKAQRKVVLRLVKQQLILGFISLSSKQLIVEMFQMLQ